MLHRALLCLLLLLPLSAAALEIPRPDGYVTDKAGLLSPATKQKLEEFLAGFEASDSTQLTVLILPDIAGETIETAALKVAESWKIGQKGKDNGALLLVAKAERKVRIEVGYGLEGRLTDLLSGRIITQEITPRFKAGDYDGGVVAGVAAMAKAVRGEYQGTGKVAGKKGSAPWWIFPLLFFVIPFFLRLGSAAAGVNPHHRRGGGGPWIGGGFGGGGSSGSW